MCDKEIVIYKGDDTDFADARELVITLKTDLDLTGFTGRFVFFDTVRDFTPDQIKSKSLLIKYDAEETLNFPLGRNFAVFTLFDQLGRRSSVSKVTICVTPHFVRPCANEVFVEVGEVYNYNALSNRPKLNGKIIEGDHDSEYYGIDLDYGLPKSVIRKGDYLYALSYDTLDRKTAEAYMERHYRIPPNYSHRASKSAGTRNSGLAGAQGFGACSCVRKGDFYGRNYDWTYDESVSFLVRIQANESRRASISVCASPHGVIREAVEEGRLTSEQWKVIPFRALDGINDCGVVCNANVVTSSRRDAGWKGNEVCGMAAVRYVLDHARTASEGAAMIAANAWMPSPGTLGHYALHYMVADATSTFIVEDGVIHDVSSRAVKAMTNFRCVGKPSVFNPDGKVNKEKLVEGDYDPYAAGTERYDAIVDGVAFGIADVAAMADLMHAIRYSVAYSNPDEAGALWPSEFSAAFDVGGKPVKVTETAEINAMYTAQKVHTRWLARTRHDENPFWQTVHSAVYDIPNKRMYLTVQENREDVHQVALFGVLWDDIVDKPTVFPPASHRHSADDVDGLADVATSGDYNDLKNKPTIPTVEELAKKRDKDDLKVYRKVKDIWTWTNWNNPDATADAPADFLATANSPSSGPLFYFDGEDENGGNWFGANQYWPNGKLKYDQGYGPGGKFATRLNFKFTAYAEDGTTQLFRFGATATRTSATDETLVSWDSINPFTRIATTDLVSGQLDSVRKDVADALDAKLDKANGSSSLLWLEDVGQSNLALLNGSFVVGGEVIDGNENRLSLKVDKEAGKGLSTNDYTDDDKAEVAKVKDKRDLTDRQWGERTFSEWVLHTTDFLDSMIRFFATVEELVESTWGSEYDWQGVGWYVNLGVGPGIHGYGPSDALIVGDGDAYFARTETTDQFALVSETKSKFDNIEWKGCLQGTFDTWSDVPTAGTSASFRHYPVQAGDYIRLIDGSDYSDGSTESFDVQTESDSLLGRKTANPVAYVENGISFTIPEGFTLSALQLTALRNAGVGLVSVLSTPYKGALVLIYDAGKDGYSKSNWLVFSENTDIFRKLDEIEPMVDRKIEESVGKINSVLDDLNGETF